MSRAAHLDRLAQLVADYRLAIGDDGYPADEWLTDLATDLHAVYEAVDREAVAAMLETSTMAEMVSAELDDDGQNWTTSDGRTLATLCRDARRSVSGDRVRYTFADLSAIVTTAGGWDLGLPGEHGACYCWAGVARDYPDSSGHNPECPRAMEVAS